MIVNFKDAFVKRITRMVKPYDEGRMIYDRYDIAQTLKQKTSAKPAQGKEMEFAIHNEMDIGEITLKGCSLFQRQIRSSPTFLVMPYWRNTKDRRKTLWSYMDDLVHSPSSIYSLEKATSIDQSTFVSV